MPQPRFPKPRFRLGADNVFYDGRTGQPADPRIVLESANASAVLADRTGPWSVVMTAPDLTEEEATALRDELLEFEAYGDGSLTIEVRKETP